MKRRRYVRLSLIVASFVMLLGAPLPQNLIFPLEPTSESEWRNFMQFHTAIESHNQFRFLYGKDDISTHIKAHQFGHALYSMFGTEAMAVCSNSISGGCLHGYLSTMIIDQGIESIGEIIAACREGRENEPFDNCEHGAGHALVFAYGYSEGDLYEALQACDKNFPVGTTETVLSNQCYHGVFMEFNQKNTEHIDAVTTRAFTETEPYAPCNMLDERYKDACYYRLTQLWVLAGREEEEVTLYEKLGEWCRALPDAQSLPACELGLRSSIGEYRDVSEPAAATRLCVASFSGDEALAECLLTIADLEDKKHVFK